MLRRAFKGWWCHLLVALGCVHLTGGPAALLQGIAWASMLVRYSAEDGVVQGVRDTFSGERPCPLCLRARALAKQRHESPASLPGSDPSSSIRLLFETLHRPDPGELSPPPTSWLAWCPRSSTASASLRSRPCSPELPPPRGLS